MPDLRLYIDNHIGSVGTNSQRFCYADRKMPWFKIIFNV